MSTHNRLLQNVSAEAGARVLYLATRFFIPPFVLSRIGIEAYGLYGAIFVLVAYFGMSAIGFSSAYVKYLAEFGAKGESDKANRLLSSGVTILSGVSVVGFSCFSFAWPAVSKWIHVPVSLEAQAYELALEIVGVFFLYLTLSVYRDALTSQQQIAAVQGIWIVTFLVETALIFALIGSGFGLRALGWAFVVRTLLDIAAHYVLASRRIPWLRVRLVYPDAESLRLLLGFGGIVQLNSLLSIFLNSIERVIAAPLLGLGAAGLLDIGKRLPSMGTSIPSAFASSVLPAAAELHARGEGPEAIRNLYLSTSRTMNLVSGFLFSFLCLAASPCLEFWLGSAPAGARELTILFAIASQLHLMTGPGTSILKACGRPAMEFHYSLANVIALGVTVPASRLIWNGWDTVGIAAACLGATALSVTWFLIQAHRQLGVSARTFAFEVLVPAALPYATGLLALCATQSWLPSGGRMASLLTLVILGCLHLVSTSSVLRAFCLKAEEKILLMQFRAQLRYRLEAMFSVRGVPAQVSEPTGEISV